MMGYHGIHQLSPTHGQFIAWLGVHPGHPLWFRTTASQRCKSMTCCDDMGPAWPAFPHLYTYIPYPQEEMIGSEIKLGQTLSPVMWPFLGNHGKPMDFSDLEHGKLRPFDASPRDRLQLSPTMQQVNFSLHQWSKSTWSTTNHPDTAGAGSGKSSHGSNGIWIGLFIYNYSTDFINNHK